MEWKKADESLPTCDEAVFCFGQYGDDDIDDGKYRFLGYVDSKGRWYASNNGDYVDGGYGHDYRARVSHWHRLPDTPTE
ncbi:DUF551 domain-containing protein [Klebsiella sp. Ap-873]|nr:DUF551 domain-containing protein [Klebsiella sp. Ap-873]